MQTMMIARWVQARRLQQRQLKTRLQQLAAEYEQRSSLLAVLDDCYGDDAMRRQKICSGLQLSNAQGFTDQLRVVQGQLRDALCRNQIVSRQLQSTALHIKRQVEAGEQWFVINKRRKNCKRLNRVIEDVVCRRVADYD